MEEGPIVLRKAVYAKVNDLDPNERGSNLVVLVKSIGEVEEFKRPDGSVVRAAEIVIGDDTACINFRARNEQIELFEVGKAYVLRNTKIDMYNSHMRLIVDLWGKISAHPDGVESTPAAPMALGEKNLSDVEYEFQLED